MNGDPFAPSVSAQKREARERAIELLYESEIRGIPITDLLENQVMPPAQMVSDLAIGISQDLSLIHI